MELILSAMSAGGLVGAADQYMCLLIMSVASRLGLIGLAPQFAFMEEWWFIVIVAVFWLLTVLPAYGSLLNPGVMNVINTVINVVSGFVVPASAALLTLASVGIIAEAHPDLHNLLDTLRIFDPTGRSIGTVGWMMAGGGALTAAALTGARFVSKPAVSTVVGTTGTVAAPKYATAENAASFLLMGLGYLLTQISPWLLVVLLAIVTLITLGMLVWSVRQLVKLGKGISYTIRLIRTQPRAGWSLVAEFLVWGSGWVIWDNWGRGIAMLILWMIWMILLIFAIPAIAAGLAVIPVVAPVFLVVAEAVTVTIGLYTGLRSAEALYKTFEETGQLVQDTTPDTTIVS